MSDYERGAFAPKIEMSLIKSEPVKQPGKRGGKYYVNKKGKTVYGERDDSRSLYKLGNLKKIIRDNFLHIDDALKSGSFIAKKLGMKGKLSPGVIRAAYNLVQKEQDKVVAKDDKREQKSYNKKWGIKE